MMTKIGIISGEIIAFLEREKRPLCVDELQFHLEEPREIILMSLGCLVRDGLAHIEKREPGYVVFLMGDSIGTPTSTRVR